ncbi:type VII toxin-antitoxin system HepT family RNase toxin [Clostridium botulinum]|uniref:type VII toxin-antitoxin system HepT family RNase toxin n=1 Tax=Clostridium botulinum TaxID=1491 RepID=UPI0007739CEB|nr:DUF86 domain-containing protein [Clostridium botulinum]MBY6809286.1 DUF86 domain-containing protein [Clostridium botulinum]MBY6822728.1 DUF86 domain-containing protein [Clostridium botulinum]MBY6833340.1 DUF86 domain-containing protein [Clostridium botulinum]MBY6931609.1 DUF86 domain-containing protein [Clostridium botulinum]MBY6971401.1 DUF86 domain-containing protein [Clostridium botulinum]
MEFDKNKIDQKLLFMDTCLNKLKKLREFDKRIFIDDFTKVDSAKYLLQVSIEAMLDIASHLIARNRWGRPKDNKEHFQILFNNRIIAEKDVLIYFNMAKFRNRIVHMYFDISDEMIYDIVQNNIDDFERFIGNIAKNVI